MSVEVDFFQSNQVFQAAGSGQLEWILSLGDNNHCYAHSFVPDSNQSIVQLSSTWYENDINGNIHFHFFIDTNGTNALFRAQSIQAPTTD